MRSGDNFAQRYHERRSSAFPIRLPEEAVGAKTAATHSPDAVMRFEVCSEDCDMP